MSEEAAQNRKSNPKAAQVRIQSAKASAYAGQRKHDLRKGAQPSYVDAAKAKDNKTLIEPPTPGELRKINEARRSLRTTYRAMRSDAAVAFVGILTFGTEAQTVFEALEPKKQAEAFEDAAQAVAERLNTTLAGLVIHRDESAVHAHFVLPSYDLDGNPLTGTVKRQTLKDLQDVVAEAFQKHAPAIERGRSVSERLEAGATRAETIHKTVRQLHADLPADLAAKEAEVEAAAARVEEMRARVEKLEAKAELTDKEAKRLETYQARLEARVAEQEAAQAEAERLAALARDEAAQASQARAEEEAAKAEAERLAGLAREEAAQAAQARDQAKAEEDAARTKAARINSAAQILAAEIAGDSLFRDEAGRAQAADPKGLAAGFPDLKPAVFATLDAMTLRRRKEAEAEADRQKAAEALKQAHADAETHKAAAVEARAEAEAAKAEVFTLRDRMKKVYSLLRLTLSRVGKYMTKEERAEADDVAQQVDRLLNPPASPPEDPVEKPKGSGDDLGL